MNAPEVHSVGLYARVSTLDKGQNPEMQLRELRSLAALKGLNVIQEYVDHGVSGAKDSRPALNRLMADAKARKFDAVLVWKLDRFSRSLKHLINSLELLQDSGLSFISLRDNLDFTTAAGRLMFQIIGAFAEFERAIIAERVAAGLHDRKAQIEANGFFVSKAGKRCERLGRKQRGDVDVERIRELRGAGKSWREIERELKIPQATCRSRFKVCKKPG